MGNKKIVYCSRTCLAHDLIAGKNSHRMWRSVKDQLPKKNQWVLIWHKEMIDFAWYDDETFFYTPRQPESSRSDSEVTHWMPLPRCPKEYRKKVKK